MKANEIFTPGSLPIITYYARPSLALEQELQTALDTQGLICSISGPSKCGKTVLCETVIKDMILVTGADLKSISKFWEKIRQELMIAKSSIVLNSATEGGEASASGEVSTGFGSFFTAKAGVGSKSSNARQQSTNQNFDEVSSKALFDILREQSFTLVVDDFHYATLDVQKSLAEEFKEAARSGLRIVVISVSHRADQAIRVNPDLRGRVTTLDIPVWDDNELIEIPKKGFQQLNVTVDDTSLRKLVKESLSSPQLMQTLCLRLCLMHKYDKAAPTPINKAFSAAELQDILKKAATTTNCATAYQILKTGPKTRGAQRTVYNFGSGKRGDIYTLILTAISSGDAALVFDYQDIKGRVNALIAANTAEPRGAELTTALKQMSKLVTEKLGEDRILEYDDETEMLNILDPYFLYYLRWGMKQP
jgi:hypothetical protein